MLITRKEEPTLGLDGTTLTKEKKYSINFTENNKKFSLSQHYNGANIYLFVNGTKIIKFKFKDSKIVATPFPVDNMKKTGLNGYVYDFSADYDVILVNDILDIHKYLTKKNNIT